MTEKQDHDDIRMPLTSADVLGDRLEQLRALIPEAFVEGKIDIDRLRGALGNFVGESRERYGLSWAGKADAIRAIQTPSVGTLVPCPKESVNFDTTENLFIEGDNLEVLKLLQKSYYGKVKMIYIDPPYNTGKEFIYPDNFREGLEEYLRYSGQVGEGGVRLSTNSETSGRFHSKWLDMMYPRLFLGRNLLCEDGFITVSIDDTELPNLRLLLNKVFGEENFVAVLVYDRNRKNDAKLFSVGHEYIVVYARSKAYLASSNVKLRAPKEGVEEIRDLFESLRLKYSDNWKKVTNEIRRHYKTFDEDDPRTPLARYTKVDEQGPFRTDGDSAWPGGGGPKYEVLHPVTNKPCRIPNGGWRWPTSERMHEEIENGVIVFGEDETTIPSVRRNLFDKDEQVMRSVTFSYAQKASQDFAQVFDGKKVFDNPKSFIDLRRLVEYLTQPGDIVMDYFAGSGTFAHSVLLANCESDTHRRFVCVQLPEPLEENTVAGKTALAMGHKTIADVCRDRIRRVIDEFERLDAEKPLVSSKVVHGFRSFRLTASNFKIWDGTEELNDEGLQQQLQLFADHVLPDRTEQDILYELILKAGLSLTAPIEEKTVADQKAYWIDGGRLFICLASPITQECLRGMADLEPQRVICLDAAFGGNDQLKTNTVLEMKSHGIEFRTV